MTTDVSRFIDVDRGEIQGEIFHSADIYEQELERVWARSWVFLAHDSMIPKRGDFLQTYIGEDPVVVVRQRDGGVKAFLNQCRHRGMRICRADRGNAKAFMCSFHGWVYDIAGNLIEVPHEETAYSPEVFDKSDWGPRPVARLESYRGFWFGTWDAEAPTLPDYLGDMAWYFDAHFDRYAAGFEAIAVHKWVIGANWKLNAEQPSSDMYHGDVTHVSAKQVMGIGPTPEREGHQFSATFGHGTGWWDVGGNTRRESVGDAWLADRRDEVVERIGERRADGVRGHANVFPNFMFLHNGTIRVTHPRGPDEFEVWAWTMVPTDAPAELKEEIRVTVLRTFSPGGLFEQDDAENWVEEQRIMRGYMARRSPLVYTMRMGEARRDQHGLPGVTVNHPYADEGSRGMYRHYLDLMVSPTWADVLERKRERGEPVTARPLDRDGVSA